MIIVAYVLLVIALVLAVTGTVWLIRSFDRECEKNRRLIEGVGRAYAPVSLVRIHFGPQSPTGSYRIEIR